MNLQPDKPCLEPVPIFLCAMPGFPFDMEQKRMVLLACSMPQCYHPGAYPPAGIRTATGEKQGSTGTRH